MRIVVAGGSGLLGRALVTSSVAAGDSVCILSRGGTAAPPGTGGPISTPASMRMRGAIAPRAGTAPQSTTVRIVLEAGELKKMIRATVEETLQASGQKARSRMLTGN